MVTSSGKNDNILNPYISEITLGSPNLALTINYSSIFHLTGKFDHNKLKKLMN